MQEPATASSSEQKQTAPEFSNILSSYLNPANTSP